MGCKKHKGTVGNWSFPSFSPFPQPFPKTCVSSALGTHPTLKPKQVPPDPSPSRVLPAPSQLVSYSQSPWRCPLSSQEMGRELGPWQGERDGEGSDPGPRETGVLEAGKGSPSQICFAFQPNLPLVHRWSSPHEPAGVLISDGVMGGGTGPRVVLTASRIQRTIYSFPLAQPLLQKHASSPPCATHRGGVMFGKVQEPKWGPQEAGEEWGGCWIQA